MSTSNAQRKSRAQKHQNHTAWKADKFKTDPKTKLVATLKPEHCCGRCAGIIQWKIDYGKYKPLTQPAKCNKCGEKKVKSAYHTLCLVCAENKLCAKCGGILKEQEIVVDNSAEEAKALRDIQKLAKKLSERKRRTFFRRLERQEKEIEEGEEIQKTLLEIRAEALENLEVLVIEHEKEKEKGGDSDFDDPDFDF